ncbi:MAG: transporter [Gemmatimonadaceae bacterium]|nr:transporter [Gemmatimonadaceae bacterium]NUQ92398.1 transporter [Gemmatimonadaceae bacterium]NUR18294.1 transporter [Gemmatimonadaceae bacterium]NUS98878.1 transporter [Gemmatimonadaceae bacterium]
MKIHSSIRARLALATALVATALLPRAGAAQDSTARETAIQDNSFLIEEAYNQERGVVQHINTFAHPTTGRAWAYTLTEEWPAPGQRHQLSYTIPVVQSEGAKPARGIGDVAVNYRYQLRGMHAERVAIAPRLTVLLPTGDADIGTGAGGTGLQANLPVSVELSRTLVTHFNAGATVTPRARLASQRARTTSWNAGGSAIWLLTHRVNAMLEASWASVETLDGTSTSRESQFLLAPGLRWSYDLANGTQIVPGIAVPLGIEPGDGSRSVFLYFSIEHPF